MPGNTASTANVHAKARNLKAYLKVYAVYVWKTSNGNEAMALSSGFTISKPASKGAKSFTAKNGSVSGTVLLETSYTAYAAFIWEISPDPIGVWTVIETTVNSKTVVTNLTPAVKQWFRVAVITSKGKQNYSDPFMVLVT